MQHAIRRPIPASKSDSGALEVHGIPAAQDNIIWAIVSRTRGEAAFVDGPNAEPALDFLERERLTLRAILNTHTHFDHIGINRSLLSKGLLDGVEVYGAASRRDEIPGITHALEDGDHFPLFGVRVDVMLTEGHIDGHLTYLVDGLAFTGDTLFGAGCGYLFDGPPEKMHASLTRLASLPDTTLVFPAHEYTEDNLRFAHSVEPDNDALVARIREDFARRARGECTLPSTILLERKTNPFLRHHSSTLIQNVSEAMGIDPNASPAEIFAATRALKDRKDYRELPESRFASLLD
ncbi:MAG: hydroxyacylglutathione hydrolase [Sandaracinaceae bacterium]|nr:hydroxyacylglutathione hydrolase [Sandaracinaceae bacterium]